MLHLLRHTKKPSICDLIGYAINSHRNQKVARKKKKQTTNQHVPGRQLIELIGRLHDMHKLRNRKGKKNYKALKLEDVQQCVGRHQLRI